ncbi:MAG TPA: prepilin-type N-terminal cleavage/methylation domain-containing protein [Polyangia bacterium]|jgi:general secretion pathway protein J|nr:prepilin-type N-terminal cleavage/methylation domain-containing protein [Polyangia bacterium]
MTRPVPRRNTEAGFTLIEVVLAVAILAFITTIMWGSFTQAVTSKRNIEASQDRMHTVRIALLRMAREIEMAYQSGAENPALPDKPRTRFDGTSHGDVDELVFSTFAHQRLRNGLAESDTTLVTYYGERDPDDRRILNLMRRETRRLQAEDPKQIPGESYILCPDVAKLKFTYYDFQKKEWENDWTTVGANRMDFLPSHVRISLTVIDERGQEVTYSTDARIQVTEKVDYQSAG